MALIIPREVALSICGRIREENKDRPSDHQARQCLNCEACCGGSPVKSGHRTCCLVRQRYARILAIAV